MPQGDPKYIRVYDNGGRSLDRYTVVYTRRPREGSSYLCMSDQPSHPQGVCTSGWSAQPIDRPSSAHRGTRITFEQLPSACQCAVRCDDQYLWNLED